MEADRCRWAAAQAAPAGAAPARRPPGRVAAVRRWARSVGIRARRDGELVGRQNVRPSVTSVPYGIGDRATGWFQLAHSHADPDITAPSVPAYRGIPGTGSCERRAPCSARSARSCSTCPGNLAYRLVGRRPDQRRGQEPGHAGRRRRSILKSSGALVLGYAARRGDDRGEQRRENHQELFDRLVMITPTRPRLARLAASAGNEGRIPENAVLASSIASGASANVSRSRGSAARSCQVNRASPSASDLMSPARGSGLQERAGLIDQLRNLWIVGVGSSTSNRADSISRASSDRRHWSR